MAYNVEATPLRVRRRGYAVNTTPELKEIPGWDAKRIGESPTLYGVAGATRTTLTSVLGFFPFAKYALPEEREEFEELSKSDKASALMWEGVGAALWLGGGPAVRAISKGGKFLAKKGIAQIGKNTRSSLQKSFTPIEDLHVWQAGNYDKALKDMLVRKFNVRGKRGKEANIEANAIIASLEGDSIPLRDLMMVGKPAELVKDLVKTDFGGPFGLPHFSMKPKVEKLIAPARVRSADLNYEYKKGLSNAGVLGTAKANPKAQADAFKAQAEKIYGKEAAKEIDLATATDNDVFNLTRLIPRQMTVLGRDIAPRAGSTIKPTRVVFGHGQEAYGTFTGIYKQIAGFFRKEAKGSPARYSGVAGVNAYTVDRSTKFKAMLADVGMMKGRVDRNGVPSFTRTKELTPLVAQMTNKLLQQMDDSMKALIKEGRFDDLPKAMAALEGEIAQMGGSKQAVRKLFDRVTTFEGTLYKEYVMFNSQKTLAKMELNPAGHRYMTGILDEQAKRLDFAFSSEAGMNYVEKIHEVNRQLTNFRNQLGGAVENNFDWFTKKGEDLRLNLTSTFKRMSMGTRGGMLSPFDNYTAIEGSKATSKALKWFEDLLGGKSSDYQRLIQLDRKRPPIDLDTRISMRISAHAKEMFLHPKIDEVVAYAQKLPHEWRDYTEHYLARILNLPSIKDQQVGRIMQGTVGQIEKMFGFSGAWDAARVLKTTKRINDFTYQGFLGFKPFSAMRNLFQPILLVPADIAGRKGILSPVKDWMTLAKGYAKVGFPLRKNPTRRYLQDIGVITDYAPEQIHTGRILRFGRTIKGRELPTQDTVRDMAMYMFKGSDQLNRYTTGGAAISRWEDALSKLGIPEQTGKLTSGQVSRIGRATGANTRNPWVRSEIEQALMKGDMAEAKKVFVKDVVADTQFLYGKVDAPLINQVYGLTGKTFSVFQSWWMNYGTLWGKWVRTGVEPKAEVKRAIQLMFSQALAYYTMSQFWGKESAFRNIGLGPFPQVSEGLPIPVAWIPLQKITSSAVVAGRVIGGVDEPARLKTQLNALVNTYYGFVPGGIQYRQSKKAIFENMDRFDLSLSADPVGGFLKSLIKYQPDE